MTGTIAADWTVTCGVCEAIRHLPDAHTSRSSALAAANCLGWYHRSKRGWVCPDCRHGGDNMRITCDLIDLADMIAGLRDALDSPPRAVDKLDELTEYLCAHCADKTNPNDTHRCGFCKISKKTS